MTLDEMEAAGKRAEAIKEAQAALNAAQENLALLKRAPEFRKDWSVNSSWKPHLILRPRDDRSYYNNEISIQVEIPYGVVEQQLVYAVDRARRKIIELGGQP